MNHICDYEPDELASAEAAYATIDPAWLVSLDPDGASVTIDGDSFTLEQLNAIAYLMENDPECLVK